MNSSANADPLAALLANLENGLSDDPNLQNVLDQMMSTIMSKELLYEPIKDLNEKVYSRFRVLFLQLNHV